ncbi:MAG: DNA internalization-related competence protein ComEC/Rec2 [Endomicrobiia bacterium]
MSFIKRDLQKYGFVWLVIGYIFLLIFLDFNGYFLTKDKLLDSILNKNVKNNRIIGKIVSRNRNIVIQPDLIDNKIVKQYKIKLILKENEDLSESLMKNDIVEVIGKIKKIPPPRNPGQFDYRKYLLRKGVIGVVYLKNFCILRRKSVSFFEKFLTTIKEKMNSAIEENIPEREAGVLKKMFLGEEESIEQEIKDIFCDAGVMHTLVVSGLHVGYVVAIFWFILRFLPFGKLSLRWIFLAPSLIIYCLITGANPPVMRATLMILVFIFCFLLGREKVVYHAFAFSAFIILIIDPQSLFGASFQLSFCACLGIVYISPKLMMIIKNVVDSCLLQARQFIEPVFARFIGTFDQQPLIFHLVSNFFNFLISLFLVSLSAQLGTAPLLAKYFYKFSIVALLSNLIVVPMVGIILWLCFGLFFSSVFLDLFSVGLIAVKFFSVLCYISTHSLIEVVNFFASVPWAVFRTGEPGTLFIVIYYLLIIVIFRMKRSLHQLIGFGLLAIFIFSSFFIFHLPFLIPRSSFHITFLDVGLGDAIFIETSSGENVFIDCGGNNSEVGKYVFLPFLWHLGITRIDRIFITTQKWTHYSGLKTLLEEFKIKEIFIGDENLDDYEFIELLNFADSKKVKIIKIGSYKKIPPFEIFYQPEEKCFVIKLTNKEFSALFTSDISGTALKKLIEIHKIEKVNVFQYPSHGKKEIPSEILQQLKPKYVVISTNSTQIRGYSTSQYGAISINSNCRLIPHISF